jgi:hypothetical protein
VSFLASGSPGFTSFLFNWPAGQFWSGGFTTAETIVIVAFLSLVFRNPLRRWLREHRLTTQSHLAQELNKLEEFVANMLNGDGVLEHHHERMREHVSAEIARLELLINQAVPALQEAPQGREEPDL